MPIRNHVVAAWAPPTVQGRRSLAYQMGYRETFDGLKKIHRDLNYTHSLRHGGIYSGKVMKAAFYSHGSFNLIL